MASLIESEAQFLQRMKDLRVSENMRRKIVNAGFSTFGVLAYAHGQPGQSIVDSQFESWVSNNLDSAASLADISCVKRLLFESQTLVLASLKEQVTGLCFMYLFMCVLQWISISEIHFGSRGYSFGIA